jgi:hypothetical protein
MSKSCHFKRFFRRFRTTTTQSETSFKFRVAAVDIINNTDLFDSSTQNTSTRVSPLSGIEHVRAKQTTSAVLKKTITIAVNIAQNGTMDAGAQVAGKFVIVIIEKFDVSGPDLFLCFLPLLIPVRSK